MLACPAETAKAHTSAPQDAAQPHVGKAYAQSLDFLRKASALRLDSPIVQARMAEVHRLLGEQPVARREDSHK